MKRRVLLPIVLLVLGLNMIPVYVSFAQQNTLDSLLTLLNADLRDTNKVIHLGYIAGYFYSKGDYENSMKYANLEFTLASELNFKRKVAQSLNNMGNCYRKFGNFAKALDCFLNALSIAEEIGNKNLIATYLCNIGVFYESQNQISLALDYYFKSLKISEEQNNKQSIGMNLFNIGNIYVTQKDYDKALAYYIRALKVGTELKEDYGIIFCMKGIGRVYSLKEDYAKALEYYQKALQMAEKDEYKNHIIDLRYFIGDLYIKTKKYDDAELYLLNALRADAGVGDLARRQAIEQSLSDLYWLTKKSTLALEHFKKAVIIKDSLFNKEKEREIAKTEMNSKFEKLEAARKSEQDQKDAVALAEKKKQQLILILVSCVLFFVFVLAAFIFRSLKITSKQKQIIEVKNQETEHQKKIIEEKNRDIISSITYAKQIQQALLRDEEHVSVHLPEHFILFIPKDIVSGDFYWGTEKDDYWYFAVADCTGHGVPGAIMSMLGISFLNDVVSSVKILSPAEILDTLRERIIKELRQTDKQINNKDGMDISLCCLNVKTLELQWAGANNPLTIVRNNTIEKIKADKQPIGFYPMQRPFTNHNLLLQQGDCIYIYSDGYADQFGGAEGKKLTYKKLDQLFLAHSQTPMGEQKKVFKNYFEEWRGSSDQIDDVCILGVRIPYA